MEKVEHKYAVYQTVYFKTLSCIYKSISCVDCGGTGVLIRKDGNEITCPTCKGNKTYNTNGCRIETVESSTVEHIEIYIEENDCSITYYLQSGIELPEVDIFSTEDEAKSTYSNIDIISNIFGLPEDYKQMFTNIPVEDWGVHINHCCKKHGCKYMDGNCPVSLGLAKQAHHCETCKDEEEEDLPF